MDKIIIGKRIPIGAAINSVALVVSAFFPEHSPAILGSAIAITFVTQVVIVNWWGVTQ